MKIKSLFTILILKVLNRTHLSLHIGDKIEIVEKNHTVVIRLIDEKKERLIKEAKRIKKHSLDEYNLLEGSLEDGLNNVQ